MIGAEDRQRVLELVAEAVAAGARKERACHALGLSVRTLQRWEQRGLVDRRQQRAWRPPNALSAAERERILALSCAPEYRDLAPKQIVPRLADAGIYLASESTFYRLLREAKLLRHRQRARPGTCRGPRSHEATAPNRVWSWDITYLPAAVQGLYYYLYLVVDVYSRKIVAWQIHTAESAENAAALLTEGCQVENVRREQLVVHADNGAPMKGATLMATLQRLGVMASYSRPAVSNDNPFSEALFRTLKYHSRYPNLPFATLLEARTWVEQFVLWYNHEHRHSAIRFVTPHERHTRRDGALLLQRHRVYQAARSRNPQRWSRQTRNWTPVGSVWLNKSSQRSRGQRANNSQQAAE